MSKLEDKAEVVPLERRELAIKLIEARLKRISLEAQFDAAKEVEKDLVGKMFEDMQAENCTSFKLVLDEYGSVQFVRSVMFWSKQEGSPAEIEAALTDPEFESTLTDLGLATNLYHRKLDTNRLHVVVRKLLKEGKPLPEGIGFRGDNKVSVRGLKGVAEDVD